MRVLCVDASAWPPDLESQGDSDDIQDGKEYDVVDVFLDEGYIFYVIAGTDEEYGYRENCFARLSNINERSMSTQIDKLLH